MKLRAMAPVLLAPVLLLVGLSCGEEDDGGLQEVTLMLNWTPNTHHNGIYAAIEKGWYEAAGLRVKIVEPATGGVEQVVAAGNADFGISIQESVIPARAEGVPIVSIGAILQHNDSSLMMLSREGVTRPKDLAGKTYGGFGGPLEIALINRLVSCDGGDASTVKFVEVGNVDYLVGMEQDRFDFAWVFESWDVIRAREVERKEVTTIKFVDYLGCIPDWYTPLFITSEKMLKEHPATVRKFMEATAKGYNYAISNPAEAGNALLKGAPELDRDLVAKSSAYMSTHFVDSGRQWGLQDRGVWEGFEKFLRESGLTSKSIDVTAAFSNEFLPR